MIDGDKRCGCGAGHQTFGECLRAKHIQLAGPDHQHFVNRHRTLTRYADARAQGIQPQSPMSRHVAKAVERSERDGEAYRA